MFTGVLTLQSTWNVGLAFLEKARSFVKSKTPEQTLSFLMDTFQKILVFFSIGLIVCCAVPIGLPALLGISVPVLLGGIAIINLFVWFLGGILGTSYAKPFFNIKF